MSIIHLHCGSADHHAHGEKKCTPHFNLTASRSSKVFAEFLGQLSAGSTINHLYQKDFVDFVYESPATTSEQAAIASILSDMEADIAMLDLVYEARDIDQHLGSQDRINA